MIKPFICAIAPMSFLWSMAPATTEAGVEYQIVKNTVDCGGGASTGGAYALSGTIGQPDAGVVSGGSFQLSGGFWTAGVPVGVPCGNNSDCVLADDAPDAVCTFDRCVSGFCTQEPIEYGDVNGAGPNTPNLDDILCCLSGFSDFNACPNADIRPICSGNDIINLDDILGVLAAFGGADPCGCAP